MIIVSHQLSIAPSDIEISAIRSQGSGGQNVNKVSTAIHLRFDINKSRLPDNLKEKLLSLNDARINTSGIIVIKAQRFRSQEKNKDDAIKRLIEIIKSATLSRKKRKPTRPSKSSQLKRLDKKTKHGSKKVLRGRVLD